MYQATKENKEDDPQEGKTKKAILRNRQRCFEKGKTKLVDEEDSRTEEYEVTPRGCP